MADKTSITRNEIGEYSLSVIDGRVRWTKGIKFNAIGNAYVCIHRGSLNFLGYIKRHGHSPTVVFDGYEDESRKSHEHLLRNLVP